MSEDKKMSLEDAVAAICQEDNRYNREAYYFISAVMGEVTKKKLDGRGWNDVEQEERQVTARQVLEGCVEFAHDQFGMMAPVVLPQWGIKTTDDVGNIVYNFVDRGFWGKSEDDKQEDFHRVFSLRERLRDIELEFSIPENGPVD